VDVAPGLPDGVRVESYGPLPRGLPLVGLAARRRALRHVLDGLGTQVLHAQFVRRYGWLAALSGVRPRVITPWGSDILRVGRRQYRTRLWNRFALRSADLVTVSSEGMRAASIRAGARSERIQLIHHGVDTERFAPGPPDPDLVRQLDVGGSAVVFSPRTVRPLYRQDVVVDAVASLATAGRNVTLVLSARGADPADLAALRERTAAAGISARLRILDDVPHEQLPDLLRIADVVVSVPETDSFPVTLLEAMACGCPVVASDLPAVSPVLGALDPVAPRLIAPVGDVAATATAIAAALDLADADRRRLGAAFREFVRRTADYDTNMARMERLYRSLAAHR
jgi:glycosyltransferase involved in cell wall biosynthesis